MNNCVICQNNFNVFNKKTLKCGHQYHTDCINKWIEFSNHSNDILLYYKCPLCRYEFYLINKDKDIFNSYIHIHFNLFFIIIFVLFFIKMVIY